MADINVERKGPSFWPWLVALGAIIVVVFIWAAMAGDGEPELATVPPTGEIPAGTAGAGGGGAVDEYVEFAGGTGGGDASSMGREHEYTAEGLRKLSAALRTVTDGSGEADARQGYERFREVADRIQQDPTSMQHAGQVREAFIRAADTIGSLDNATGADRVESIAQFIDADQPLLDQRDKVQNFFRESARAIQSAQSR